MSTVKFEAETTSSEDKALALQDRFIHGFSGLRRQAGMSQRDVAREAGWHQPYVQRLEDARSPLLRGLSRLERYAQACGFTAVVVFVDKQTGELARTLPLDESGEETAERLLSGAAGDSATFGTEMPENEMLEDAAASHAAQYNRA